MRKVTYTWVTYTSPYNVSVKPFLPVGWSNKTSYYWGVFTTKLLITVFTFVIYKLFDINFISVIGYRKLI